MYETTVVEGKLECSCFLTVLYEEEHPSRGVLVLGDSLYYALLEATGEEIGFGGPHIIRGQAKITGRFFSSSFREYSLVLYDVNSYHFFPVGSQTEFNGTLPNRSKIEVELLADGSFPIIRFPGKRLPAMVVDMGTITNLQLCVRRVTEEKDTQASRDDIQRNLFRKIQTLYNQLEEGLKIAGDLKEFTERYDPQA